MKKLYLVYITVFIVSNFLFGQVYKTPFGKKYHLSDCRMVENVSRKILDDEDIIIAGLKPCKICKPPYIGGIKHGFIHRDKSVGESVSVRCKGRTKKGYRCRHKTTLANGYCYQHTYQNSSSLFLYPKENQSKLHTNFTCGARTKSGGFCKRKVKGGGHCYQH